MGSEAKYAYHVQANVWSVNIPMQILRPKWQTLIFLFIKLKQTLTINSQFTNRTKQPSTKEIQIRCGWIIRVENFIILPKFINKLSNICKKEENKDIGCRVWIIKGWFRVHECLMEK